ncbi:TerD family protein [Streptomyces lateritius]|uniref:TerD family protein n=1 Tax=Streptomyces lateritius TaxID=67313 RepID=UPI00198D8599|nr:TerD family protein [Streptomyces lateritius]GGU16751.1 hypothetical protein GCM10010272_71400 [Streptomyces lateritius]
MEAAVERIVIAGSADGGTLTTVAPDGAPVASYTVTGTPDATAVAFAEFFRDSGGWKFGPLGKAYGSGLQSYGVDGRTGGRLPDMDLLLNETGSLQQTIPVPRGPQLLCLRSEGSWTFTVKELG